jgi:hypothetical protein
VPSEGVASNVGDPVLAPIFGRHEALVLHLFGHPGGCFRGIIQVSLFKARYLYLKQKNLVFSGALTFMEEPSGLHNFLEIVTKPDNIPIVAMLILVIFFTWLGLREAFKNDKLIEEGKEDEIPNEMWK